MLYCMNKDIIKCSSFSISVLYDFVCVYVCIYSVHVFICVYELIVCRLLYVCDCAYVWLCVSVEVWSWNYVDLNHYITLHLIDAGSLIEPGAWELTSLACQGTFCLWWDCRWTTIHFWHLSVICRSELWSSHLGRLLKGHQVLHRSETSSQS